VPAPGSARRGGRVHIKFTHSYVKLHCQTKAHLLGVTKREFKSLCAEFVEYDTAYLVQEGIGHYDLGTGKFLVLVFIGNKLIPFTTVRPWTEEKEKWYKSNIGREFDIQYTLNQGSTSEENGQCPPGG
jgi:hypothetical protein